MGRVDVWLGLVEEPSAGGGGGAALAPGHPSDDALLALVAHMACSDGEVHPSEVDFLARLLPGRAHAELANWARAAAALPLDLAAIGRALPTVEERWKGLRFAARMAWKDGSLADAERALLERVVAALDLPPSAIDAVLTEVQGRLARDVTAAELVEAVKSIGWDAVMIAGGKLKGPLAKVVPPGAVPVARVGLGRVEVLGIYQEGLAGRFLEGDAFLGWAEIVTYTRVPVLGAALRLHTEDGRALSLVDARLAGVARLLDRLARPEAPKERPAAPKVEKVR